VSEAHESQLLAELADEYALRGEIGRGGSAIVYLAQDRSLFRDVAIKVVRPRFVGSADEAIARLEREARTVARLQHPGIVTVHAVKRLNDGGLALVMQFVPGRTLKQVIQDDGPFPPERAERVLRDIAEALAFAHAHGVVHRDVKPENVFLDATSGRALLSDFGIAHSTEFDSRLTMDGAAIGTPAYMAPEQIDGAPANARSDLYSLGLVGWEMLTGERPWDGDALYNVIYKQKHEQLPAIDALRPGQVPPRLQYIVERMLQKKPAARWAGADGLLVALNAWVIPSDWAQWEASHKRRREREALEPRAKASGAGPVDAATIRFIRGDLTIDAAPRQLQLAPGARAPLTPAAEPEAAGDDVPSWASEEAADDEAVATPPKRRWRLPIAVLLMVLVGSGAAAAAWRLKVGPYASAPRAVPMPKLVVSVPVAPVIAVLPDTATPDSLVPLDSAVAERPRPESSAATTGTAAAPSARDSVAAIRGAPVALRVRPGNAVLLPSEEQRLSPSLIYANGETVTPAQLIWSSGNADVVTVDARGRITGVSPGTTVVFARRGALSALVSVTVRFALAAQLEITPADPIVERGGTVRLRASLRDASGTPMTSRPLIWSSSNDDVAIVSSNGVVVGVAPGVATITASADAVSATISVIVR
jgi:tRNA A-37 threonylcarbamoyl transferase component Bud32